MDAARVARAAPVRVVDRVAAGWGRKCRDSRSLEAGVQAMARVSAEEGGTGRVRVACTEE